jgi:mRNA interferase MazF
MAAPAAGAVVLVRFPFSDLSNSKLRPAVVLANAGRGDFVLCQITSNPYADPRAIELTEANFQTGSLEKASYARPGKLFTSSESLIARQIGQLKSEAQEKVTEAVVRLLRAG